MIGDQHHYKAGGRSFESMGEGDSPVKLQIFVLILFL
jgi:hypothetical protein